MADFKIHKVVSSLPGTLEADTIYLVRTGSGFDLYVSDTTGSVAHKVNPNQTWTSAGGGLVYFTPNPIGGSLAIEGYGDSGVTESFFAFNVSNENFSYTRYDSVSMTLHVADVLHTRNTKTINGESIRGSGDISVAGGSSNLVIGSTIPTPPTGEQVLWLDTTGGNVSLNLVTGD